MFRMHREVGWLQMLLIVAVAVTGSPQRLHAETRVPAPPPPEDEMEVVVVTAPASGTIEAGYAASVEVLDAWELDWAHGNVLSDRLRGLPGVHLQSTTPGQGSPIVRGLIGSSVLNLVDGFRLNHAMFRSAPNPDLALIDPHAVERVTVIRGPSSVRHGSDAMGGVVKIETRRPIFDTEEWQVQGLLSGRFGSADLSGTGHAELEAGRSGLGVRVGASYMAADDVRGGRDTGVQEPTAYDWLGGDAAIVFEPFEGHRTTLNAQYLEQPESSRYDEQVAGFGQDAPSSDVWSYEPLARWFAHVSHEIDMPLWSVVDVVGIDAGFQRIVDDRRTRAHMSSTEVRERNRSKLFGLAAHGEASLGGRVTLAWGGDAYFDRVRSRRTERDVGTGVRTEVQSRFPDGSRMNSYGVFAEATVDLTSSLRAQAGVRYSHFDVEVAGTQTTRRTTLRLDDVTGGVGLLWFARSDLQLAANLRRGVRAPNVFDLGTLGERPGNRFNVPSASLDPEVIYSADLGVRWRGRRLTGELVGFYSLYEDRIESVETGALDPGGRRIVTSANLGEVWLAGVEARARYALSSSWALLADLQYTWGEARSGGTIEPADRVPPLQGGAGVRWAVSESLWVEPFLRAAARQGRLSARDAADPRIDPGGTPGWFTLNARARWIPSERIAMSLAVLNLTDRSYREHGSGVDAHGVGATLSVELRIP